MPHIRIEYTPNLKETVQGSGLVPAVHAAAVGTGVFPLWGTRTVALAVDAACVGDGDPANGFVHIGVRLAPGRSAQLRAQVARALLDAATACLAPNFATGRIGCQVEISEFDAAAFVYRIRLADAEGGVAEQVRLEPTP